jgi:hypothetical protein
VTAICLWALDICQIYTFINITEWNSNTICEEILLSCCDKSKKDLCVMFFSLGIISGGALKEKNSNILFWNYRIILCEFETSSEFKYHFILTNRAQFSHHWIRGNLLRRSKSNHFESRIAFHYITKFKAEGIDDSCQEIL